VKHDRWSEETAWTLTNMDSDDVVASQDEDQITADYELVEEEYDVVPGQYQFRMTDRYGDGICCAYGDGWFKVYVGGVLVIDSNGEFAGSTETTFTV